MCIFYNMVCAEREKKQGSLSLHNEEFNLY